MTEPLIPAKLSFQDSVPFSERFGDVYHSAAGGLEQARHVFLSGNRLPERWAGRERFVILETGFGLGLNFLATWQAWRQDPSHCARLHFVSIEKHPYSVQDLRTLHANYPEVKAQAMQLHAAWPVLVPGGHRFVFEGGAVTLTLFLADIKDVRDLRLAADAIYLDGFAPARNPEMWSPQTLRAVARLAAPGATAATWSVAAPVRAALETVGFEIEKLPGFGHKRETLRARYLRELPEKEKPRERKATVVGAGLAGAAVCESLCRRGWEVTLVERHAASAQEASGNHAGAYHPIVTPDDSMFARLTRAGFLACLKKFSSLDGLRWDPCGVLQLSRTGKEADSQRASIGALALPPEYAQLVDAGEASAHAGVPVAAGGLWFPQGGWVKPQSLVNALLDTCGSSLKRVFGHPFSFGTERSENTTIILATADDALLNIPHARLRRVRGQLTYLPADSFEPPHAVVLRGGMVLPPVDGLCVVGASFDIDDDDPQPRAESDAGNLERLGRMIPGFKPGMKQETKSRVAFRTVARDRLPVVGRIGGDVYAALAFGSRGLIWSSLAADILAAALEGEPMPVEGKLVDALKPERFFPKARMGAGSPGSRPRRS